MMQTPWTAARGLGVWLVVTGSLLATALVSAKAAASLLSPPVWRGPFEELLVSVASAALLGCTGTLWMITTATLADLARHGVPVVAPPGVIRPLLLAACGAAAVAALASPALAGTEAPTDPTLAGLPLPDRAVAPVAALAERHSAAPPPVGRRTPLVASAPTSVTVRTGDSLWTIAAAGLTPSAEVAEVDAAWRALYAANRTAIGPDPDLIRPGLILHDPTREARP